MNNLSDAEAASCGATLGRSPCWNAPCPAPATIWIPTRRRYGRAIATNCATGPGCSTIGAAACAVSLAFRQDPPWLTVASLWLCDNGPRASAGPYPLGLNAAARAVGTKPMPTGRRCVEPLDAGEPFPASACCIHGAGWQVRPPERLWRRAVARHIRCRLYKAWRLSGAAGRRGSSLPNSDCCPSFASRQTGSSHSGDRPRPPIPG